MSYTFDVEPDAMRALRTLDFKVQEAVFDLLDRLGAEGPQLAPVFQRHDLHVRTPTGRTYVLLDIVVVHSRQLLHLSTLHAAIL